MSFLVSVIPGCSGCRNHNPANDGARDVRPSDVAPEVAVDAVDSADTSDAGPGYETIAADSEGSSGIALDADFVYWTNYISGKISRVRKTGGTPELLCTVARSGNIDIAVDDAFLYVTAPADIGQPEGVLRVAKIGGSVEVLSSNEPIAHSLVVDKGELFWMTGSSVLTGGARKMDLSTRNTITLADGYMATGFLTVDATNVYFAVGRPKGQGKIVRVSRSGGSPSELAAAEQGPWGIWNDDQFIYWTDGFYVDSDNRAIKRLDKTAAPSTAPDVLRAVTDQPAQLLGDGTNVYWNDFPTDQIWELPKAPSAAPRRLSFGFNVSDLAIDEGYIYWVNISSPHAGVYRISK